MRRASWTLVVAFALLAQSGSPIDAAQRGGPISGLGHLFESYGLFGQSCGKFSQASVAERQVYEWWMLGFVSGVGYATTEPLRKTDAAGIKAWVTKYCAEHPLD